MTAVSLFYYFLASFWWMANGLIIVAVQLYTQSVGGKWIHLLLFNFCCNANLSQGDNTNGQTLTLVKVLGSWHLMGVSSHCEIDHGKKSFLRHPFPVTLFQ